MIVSVKRIAAIADDDDDDVMLIDYYVMFRSNQAYSNLDLCTRLQIKISIH